MTIQTTDADLIATLTHALADRARERDRLERERDQSIAANAAITEQLGILRMLAGAVVESRGLGHLDDIAVSRAALERLRAGIGGGE